MWIGRAGLLFSLAVWAAAGAAAQTASHTPPPEPPRFEGWAWSERPLPDSITDSTTDSLPADTVTVLPDPWLGRDKALHAAGSFLLTLSAQYVLTNKAELTDGEAFPVSAASVLALGVAKELYDSRRRERPLFSFRDLTADAVGILLAAVVVAL